ncbi:unnamed protein product, partial [Linum tenue]
EGRFGEINQAGIAYYNELIDALVLKGVQPFVTLCHFDMPQELEDRYGSWGTFPPSRCSGHFGNCTAGDSETEPYIAAHNIILSHAAAVDVYRTKYQKDQKGMIGIVLHCAWFEPFSESEADGLATDRANAFFANWFFDPIVLGRYPEEMSRVLGSTLPEFSSKDMEKLKQGLDFLGINHYTSYYIKDCIYSACEPGLGTTRSEGSFQTIQERDGFPMGKRVSFFSSAPSYIDRTGSTTYLKFLDTIFRTNMAVSFACWICRVIWVGNTFTHKEWRKW